MAIGGINLSEEILNGLKEEREKLLKDLLGSEEEEKSAILERIMDIDDVIESHEESGG